MLIKTKITNRAFPNLDIGISKLRESSFLDIYSTDLAKLVENNLCCIFYQGVEYVIFFYSKNAFNSKFELFLNCFPNNGVITHSIDELNEFWREKFFTGIETSQEAIKEYINNHNGEIQRIYAYQHIGVNELNSYDFKTTYPQTHWHIYGVDKETTNNCIDLDHTDHSSQNTFYEFFIECYADLFGLDPKSIDYKTYSLILRKRKISLKIDNIDRTIITEAL